MAELTQIDTFHTELGSLPRSIYKKVSERYAILRDNPTSHSTIKRLKGYRDLWRIRIGDYRLVYRHDASADTVTMLMVGGRKDIYDRLDTAGSDDEPGVRIIAANPELLEPLPTPQQIGSAITAAEEAEAQQPPHEPQTLLPVELTREWLTEHRIPEPFHESLVGIRTEGALLGAEGIPTEWHDKVMELVFQRPLEETIERPSVVTPDTPDETEDETRASNRSLMSFLLPLDPDQQQLLDSFAAGQAEGPWLVRGGPGSGKTIVTVYAIRDLVLRAREEGRTPRILFTTYTRALATAAEQLLLHLDIDPDRDGVEVANLDALARQISPARTRVITEGAKGFPDLLKAALMACIHHDRSFPWSIKDEGFLMEEVAWVILGRIITERDVYLKADRTGRSRSLDDAQRRHLWAFYLALREELRKAKRRLFEDVLVDACEHAEAEYDHVFVDEVHDLKPVAVELCVKLCSDPKRVFLTLDPNQSIYGARRGWAESLPKPMAAPRSVILKRNHRSTGEIWEATQQILAGLDAHDPETLADRGPLSGPTPLLVAVTKDDEAKRIADFLHESLIGERASLGCAAILCPTHWDCHSVAKALPARLRARVMESKDLDLDHNGVKVLTMHAAKGLQFPVVMVARLDKGRFPSKPPPGVPEPDHMQQNRRLLFVACSRAMRRLMILHTPEKASPLLAELDDGAWQMEP